MLTPEGIIFLRPRNKVPGQKIKITRQEDYAASADQSGTLYYVIKQH